MTLLGSRSPGVGGRIASAAVVLAMLAAALGPGPASAGGEYDMNTRAGYVVDDAAGKVLITVDIAFKNTFRAPAGQVSLFRTIRLAIHDHATAVTARDAAGALKVTVGVAGGVNVATINLRSPVEYNETAQLTLAYELADGADEAVRVGPHLVSFPAWGFGTQSEVRVEIAADYEVRVDGDELEATVEGDQTILTSGAIENPTQWLSHIGATREPSYETLQRPVPLDGGTVDLQVRHWVDDPEWGTEMRDLVTEALPLLEDAFGFPYPGQGPLVITETVTAGGPDVEADPGEIAVGFAEPPFTVLHQVAHVWAGDALGGDRWMTEGLASWAAGRVSTELEIDLPHDPAAVAESLKANAFPLAEWDTTDRPSAVEGWAYAAAWALTDQAAALAGDEAFQAALGRMAAGLDGYDPLAPSEPASEEPEPAVDPVTVSSRAYLDHLDAVTTEPIVEALATPVLGNGAADELASRAEARTAYDGLLEAAGDWGDPDPVRDTLVGWRFGEATQAIGDAGEWLVGRDALMNEIERAGLTAPARLRAAYEVHGGAPEAWAEIDAERAVADAYGDGAAAIEDGIGPVARIGLLLGPSPEDRLARANTAFAAGDLRVAADELALLNQELGTATAGGLIRLLGVVVMIGVAGALGTMAIRRYRTGTDYTPEP